MAPGYCNLLLEFASLKILRFKFRPDQPVRSSTLGTKNMPHGKFCKKTLKNFKFKMSGWHKMFRLKFTSNGPCLAYGWSWPVFKIFHPWKRTKLYAFYISFSKEGIPCTLLKKHSKTKRWPPLSFKLHLV